MLERLWAQLIGGQKFEFERAWDHDQIPPIELAATALSQQNRYNGNTDYGACSLARHQTCVCIALRMSGAAPAVQFEGLHHDTPEMITGDMVYPMKEYFSRTVPGFARAFNEIETKVERAVGRAYGVTFAGTWAVKEADLASLEAERRRFMREPPRKWVVTAMAEDDDAFARAVSIAVSAGEEYQGRLYDVRSSLPPLASREQAEAALFVAEHRRLRSELGLS
jgi:hypothetical protein